MYCYLVNSVKLNKEFRKERAEKYISKKLNENFLIELSKQFSKH